MQAGRGNNGLVPVLIGLGALNLLVVVLVTLGLLVFFSGSGPEPQGSGPLLSSTHSATNTARGMPGRATGFRSYLHWLWPAEAAVLPMGGLYACDTCRGYPNGPRYSRDSWRWQD